MLVTLVDLGFWLHLWFILVYRFKHVGEPFRCCGTHARKHMLVGGHSESGVGVTESFGNDLDGDPAGHHERCVGMA